MMEQMYLPYTSSSPGPYRHMGPGGPPQVYILVHTDTWDQEDHPRYIYRSIQTHGTWRTTPGIYIGPYRHMGPGGPPQVYILIHADTRDQTNLWI